MEAGASVRALAPGAGFVGKQGSVGELAGELALSMLKLQDTFFDGVLGHHLIHVDVFGLADTMCSVGGLILCGGVPPWVGVDDHAGTGQGSVRCCRPSGKSGRQAYRPH